MNRDEQETSSAPPPETAPTPEMQQIPSSELEALRKAAAELEEVKLRLKTVQAEYYNFQIRAKEERERERAFAAEQVLREMLGVLDTIELCRKSLPEANPEVLEPVAMMEREVLRILAKCGVTPIDALGRMFDTRMHLAVGLVETRDHPEMTVVEEVQRGFWLHDRVLRPARVRLARPPRREEEGAAASKDAQTDSSQPPPEG